MMAGTYVLQINTELDCETGSAFDAMCRNDERTKAQQVKWLIKQEVERRGKSCLSLMQVLAVEDGDKSEFEAGD